MRLVSILAATSKAWGQLRCSRPHNEGMENCVTITRTIQRKVETCATGVLVLVLAVLVYGVCLFSLLKLERNLKPCLSVAVLLNGAVTAAKLQAYRFFTSLPTTTGACGEVLACSHFRFPLVPRSGYSFEVLLRSKSGFFIGQRTPTFLLRLAPRKNGKMSGGCAQ